MHDLPKPVRHTAVLAVIAAILPSACAAPADQTIEVGRQIYKDRCAGCHGVNLEGQPDWRNPLPSGRLPAPPHDASGHTWHHSDAQLFSITKEGLAALVPGYQSDMPAFAGVLSDEEIRAVLDYIKSTWPQREREYQGTRSMAGAGS